MSNFSISGDLLNFVGADVRALEYEGKVRNCVIIPVDWNDLEVKVNDQNKPVAVPFYGRAWEVKEAYLKACMEKNAGDPNFIAPSHTVELNWREDFMNKAVDAAFKRMKVDSQSTGVTDEDLKKKALYEVRNRLRLGTMKVLAKREQPTLQGPAVPLQSAPQEFSPEVNGSDDLPF